MFVKMASANNVTQKKFGPISEHSFLFCIFSALINYDFKHSGPFQLYDACLSSCILEMDLTLANNQ